MVVQPGVETSEEAGWETIARDLGMEAGGDDLIASLNPEVVVHLAAQSSAGQALRSAESTWRTNIVGALNLAGGIARHGSHTRLVLFTSTGEVYGSSCLAGPASEDTPARFAPPAESTSTPKVPSRRLKVCTTVRPSSDMTA